MDLKAIKTLTAAALLATATAASAGTAPFSMVSGATAPGIDVSLTVQQSAVPGYDYDFVVTNNSLMGIVTGVYFEADWNSMLNGVGNSSGPASLNTGLLSPAIAGWEGSKASHTVEIKRVRKLEGRHYKDYYYDNLAHGVQEGQAQTFSFTADPGIVSLQDLYDMIGAEGHGVAIRMQGLTENEQATGWGQADQREQEMLFVQRSSFASLQAPEGGDNGPQVTAAPTPTAGLAGLALLGIAGLRRRRRN